VQRLLGIKPIYTFTRYPWIAFFLLTFWTTFALLVLFLQIILKNLFKVFLQIVKGTWIRFREAFSRFEIFSPYFKCFPFDLNKTPLDEIRLLVFKRVLPIWKRCRYQLKNLWIYNKIYQFENFEIDGGAVLLLWANTLSPFGMNRQK
jgi:hypothetical protein